MEKEWFIQVDGVSEGPFNIKELKKHKRITPDTPVRKKGFSTWRPMRHVPELKEVFEDDCKESQSDETDNNQQPIKATSKKLAGDDEVLTLQFDPFFVIIWLLVILFVLLYIFYLNN